MNYTYSENYGLNNLYSFIGTQRLLCFIPVFILGTVWIVKLGKYFVRINKDREFIDSLEDIYREKVLPKKGIFVRRAIKVSMAVLLIGLALSADFRLDGVNLFPDFIVAPLVFTFFKIIGRQVKVGKSAYISAAVHFIAGAAYSIMEFIFLEKYGYSAVMRSTEAEGFFYALIGVGIAAALAFFWMFANIMLTMGEVINRHVRSIGVSENHASAQRAIIRQRRSELYRGIAYMVVAFALYLVSDVCYTVIAGEFAYMFTINVVLAVIFCALTFKAYNDIYSAVDNSYMLE